MEEDGSTAERKIKMKDNKPISCKQDIILIITTTIIILVLVQFMKNPLTSEDYSILLAIAIALCIKSVIITAMHNKALNKER